MITGTQCIAARGLLRWKQTDLSKAISKAGGKLSVTAITAFENGGSIRASNADLIERALVEGGITLIPENGGGAGVRMRDRESPSDSGNVLE